MAEMTKITGGSKDLVAERIDALKKLVPEAFAEGKIDFDALKGALGDAVDSSKEHYRFTWNGKEEARAFALRPSMGTLRPCVAESSGKDGTDGKFDSENLYIEGDNLEVLKLLQGAYHNAVKMIYIDPPYNTGHDFVYADDFSDSLKNYKQQTGQSDGEGRATHANAETSGRYHTDWLNMMFPRLLLARNLLKKEGLIVISIDYKEAVNLQKLCDEVFGEDNRVNDIAVKMSELSGVKMKHLNKFAKLREDVLIYAKDINALQMTIEKRPKDPETLKGYLKYYSNVIANPQDAPEEWKIVPIKQFLQEQGIEVAEEELDKWKIENGDRVVYRTNSRTVDAFISENPDAPAICSFKNEDGNTVVKWDDKEMLFLSRYTEEYLGDIWMDISTINLNKENEGVPFDDGQKPLALLKRILKCIDTKDAIILDFFAGSSSTAHAVIEQNIEDGGDRKYIMVQLPENLDLAYAKATGTAKSALKSAIAFCDDLHVVHALTELGKERLRRVGMRILSDRPKQKIGFKVFKLDTSNLIPWNPNPEDLKASLLAVVDNAVVGRTADDLLYEILLKCNLPLTLAVEKKAFGANTIAVVGEGALMICLDQTITAAVAEEMVRLRDEVYKPAVAMQVVFRDGGFTDKEKANAIATLVQAGVEERAILSI